MNEIQKGTVTFNNRQLTTLKQGDQVFVAMKPVVEGMGLNWDSQRKRIRRDPILSPVAVMMTGTGSDGKSYDLLCLPLDKLNGWLAGIDANRVRPELKDTIIEYQKHCYDVLYSYWHGKEMPERPQFKVPRTYLEAMEECVRIEKERLALEHKVDVLQPKADVYDAVMSSSNTFSMAHTAQIIDVKNMGRNKLMALLRKERVLKSDNTPYQSYINRGWFKVQVTNTISGPKSVTKTTAKGIEGVLLLVKQWEEEDLL